MFFKDLPVMCMKLLTHVPVIPRVDMTLGAPVVFIAS
jgi:hypothetical protein